MIADRTDKRRPMMTTQGISAVLCGALATVTVLGLVHVWEVYAVAFAPG